MTLFVDTSALYALLVASESDHDRVVRAFDSALRDGRLLVSSNYIQLETTALLQRRFGLQSVRDLERGIAPLLRILWVSEEVHRRALSLLLRADQQALSLVDCVSFVLMEREGIQCALALDAGFERQGFEVLPT